MNSESTCATWHVHPRSTREHTPALTYTSLTADARKLRSPTYFRGRHNWPAQSVAAAELRHSQAVSRSATCGTLAEEQVQVDSHTPALGSYGAAARAQSVVFAQASQQWWERAHRCVHALALATRIAHQQRRRSALEGLVATRQPSEREVDLLAARALRRVSGEPAAWHVEIHAHGRPARHTEDKTPPPTFSDAASGLPCLL